MYNCAIDGNSADISKLGGGGGIYNGGSLYVTNGTEIDGNSAYDGGGIENGHNGSVNIDTACAIDYKTAYDGGGGVFNLNSFTMSGGEISNNTVTGNKKDEGGGALLNRTQQGLTPQATLTGVTIDGNSAANNGGAFYLETGTALTLNSCSFSGNTAPVGNDICFQPGTTYTLTNCTGTIQIVQDPNP